MLGSMTKAKIFFPNAPAQGYKVSKTALNMLTVQWALEYASKGFTFLGISPGVRFSASSFLSFPLPFPRI